jgi:hypothetical protein
MLSLPSIQLYDYCLRVSFSRTISKYIWKTFAHFGKSRFDDLEGKISLIIDSGAESE